MDKDEKKDEDIEVSISDSKIKNTEKESDDAREDQIENLKKEAEANLDGWQRAKADFVNYKRDQERIFADFKSFANEDAIIKLLPTVDSFDLALKHVPEELESSDWVKGVLCIKGLFENFLKDIGVTEVEVLGKKFDPNISEAIIEEESDQEEGIVLEEMQKGYRLNGKLIRPAKVKVSKSKNK